MAVKFATITTASQSGIFLPVEVVSPLVPAAINTFRAALAIYGLQPMTTPNTNQINIPVLSATSGGKVAETASSETENEPGLTESIVSKPAPYQSGSSWFSNTQLQANDFDLLTASVPAMVASKELALEADIVSTIIADAGVTQVVTTAGTATITFADLVALDNALPKRFQMQKVILLSASAYSAAEALTFASGPTVLTTDANGVKRFQGTPVLRSDNFQSLATGHTIGIVVSLAGFHLRDAGQPGLERYSNIPSRPAQTGMNLIGNHSYGYAASAVAKFKNA
jgi:HK97 family phage major capsid protein